MPPGSEPLAFDGKDAQLHRSGATLLLYWIQGSHFYSVGGDIEVETLVALAESIR